MGEEIPWDEVPAPRAVEFGDYFRHVRLSPRAIDQASRIVPVECWHKHGIYTWLSQRANYVFSKLTTEQTRGIFGVMKYNFEYDSDGPVLSSVSL